MRECPACKLCFPDDVVKCPNDADATFHSISGEPVLDSRYQLIKRLGQGGMGVVYRARHSYLKTAHAIKVILPDLVGNDPMLVTRFRQEALAAAAIRHRNIVNVTDFGVAEGTMPFLVMEYVEGESLHDLLLREKRLNPGLALEVLSAICSGLGAAHRHGIVHRDLKPLNVMIQRGAPLDEAIKLLDFGLAKIKSGELLGSFIQAKTTGLMGSPYYMAPEQWSDDEPEASADVYSVGVMLHQMLTGEVPFKGSSIPAIMKKHLSDAPPTFAECGVDLPLSVERVVQHALEKDPANRTQTVEELVKEFRAAIAGTNIDTNLKTMANVAVAQPAPKSTEPPAIQPVTTLRVLTIPPQSQVFLDGKLLGKSEANGWLVAENIRRGKHQIRVLNEGYGAWDSEISCEEETCQAVAQLQSLMATNIGAHAPNIAAPQEQPRPQTEKVADAPAAQNYELSEFSNLSDLAMPLADSGGDLGKTAANQQPFGLKSYPNVPQPETKPEPKPETKPEAKRAEIVKPEVKPQTQTPPQPKPQAQRETPKPLVSQPTPAAIQPPAPKIKVDLAAQASVTEVESGSRSSFLPFAAIFVVCLVLVVGGGYAAYRLLFAPTGGTVEPTKANDNPKTQDTPVKLPGGATKAEMVSIPGGTFSMGRAGGAMQESPAHSVTVKPFSMDKTEVTNKEYGEFVQTENHNPPSDWNGTAPPAGQESKPVVNVSVADAEAFAKWRSKRDGAEYRLPTEEEWEFAARNGEKNNLYPWGDQWADGKAAVKSANLTGTQPVGSLSGGGNQWGAVDLIGNVWEWTASRPSYYAGNPAQANPAHRTWNVARGGSIMAESTGAKAITSAYRDWFAPDTRNQFIGFRLVRSGS